MRSIEFKKWMMGRKRFYNGKLDYYSELAVESRISCLKQLEEYFNIDLDIKVKDKNNGEQFLRDIRDAQIEDLAHTPLSNAFRHYFEFETGQHIERIF